MSQNKQNKMVPILVSMGLCVAALGAGVTYYSYSHVTAEEETPIQPVSPVTAAQTPTLDTAKLERQQQQEATKQETTQQENTTNNTNNTNTSTKETTQQSKQNTTTQSTQSTASLTFQWPVQGEIVLPYSVEQAVYDPTLEQYRTNDTLCIAAEAGSTVAASANGVVAEIKDDEENGKTLVLEHANGWRTTYGPLTEENLPQTGETIAQGETIGTIAEPTKYQVALGSHLVFSMQQNGESIDPTTKLPS